jgi:hypothetical protein
MKRREFIGAGVATLSLRAARSTVGQAAAIPARTQERVKPANRAEATAIVAAARRILTANGVERLEKVKIGGIEQWVSSAAPTGEILCCCTSMADLGTCRSR